MPALASSVEEIVRSILETGEPATGVEVAAQRADLSEERFWVTYWHPRRGPAGNIVGTNVAAEEITERKRAEAALLFNERESEGRGIRQKRRSSIATPLKLPQLYLVGLTMALAAELYSPSSFVRDCFLSGDPEYEGSLSLA